MPRFIKLEEHTGETLLVNLDKVKIIDNHPKHQHPEGDAKTRLILDGVSDAGGQLTRQVKERLTEVIDKITPRP